MCHLYKPFDIAPSVPAQSGPQFSPFPFFDRSHDDPAFSGIYRRAFRPIDLCGEKGTSIIILHPLVFGQSGDRVLGDRP